MNTTTIPRTHARWTLPRLLILLLAGAFLNLMLDLRVEHVDVVHEDSIAWLPIIYSAFMTLACVVACAFWNRKLTHRIMIALFVVAFAIGGTGFYLHNHGKLTKVLATSLNAWIDPNMNHLASPPQLAPLAFAGLGTIGLLASLNRFNS